MQRVRACGRYYRLIDRLLVQDCGIGTAIKRIPDRDNALRGTSGRICRKSEWRQNVSVVDGRVNFYSGEGRDGKRKRANAGEYWQQVPLRPFYP